MTTASIRKQLQHYLQVADERKLKAIYVMVEDDLRESEEEYSPALKKELDRRVDNYLKKGNLVSAREMNKRLQTIRGKK